MVEINEVHLCLKKDRNILCNDVISNSEEAFPLFWNEIGMCSVERLALLYLDFDFRPIKFSIIGIGTSKNVNIDIAEIFKIALLVNAKHIIVAHNHVGSSIEPTNSDLNTTQQIGYIGKILNIELIDSLIIGENKEYLSIRQFLIKKEDEKSGLE